MAIYTCTTCNPQEPNLSWRVQLSGEVKEYKITEVLIKDKNINLLTIKVSENNMEYYICHIYGKMANEIEKKIYNGKRLTIHGRTWLNSPYNVLVDIIE